MDHKRFRFVQGNINAAIYDIESGKVYSINDTGREIVLRFLNGEGIVDETERSFIAKIKKMGIDMEALENDLSIEYTPARQEGLRYAWLELTEKCNCNCIHCYGMWGDLEKNRHMWFDKIYWNNILDEIYARGGRDIQLIGGEPLLHPDFKDILKHAHEIGFERIDCFTNATMIDDSMASCLKAYGASVRVSLYGHCAELHEKVTQVPGSFHRTERGLKLLKAFEIPTQVAVVVMDINEDYIEQIKDYIESLGHKYQGYDTIRQAAGGNQASHCVSRTDVLKTKYQTRANFKTSKDTFELNHSLNTCWDRKLAFAADGNVYPCIFARDYKIGNTQEDSLDEIWERAAQPWRLSVDNIDTCKSCEFRYACTDCRPLAKSITGNLFGRFQRCTYDPIIGKWMNLEDVTSELKTLN